MAPVRRWVCNKFRKDERKEGGRDGGREDKRNAQELIEACNLYACLSSLSHSLRPSLSLHLAHGEVQHAGQKYVALIIHPEGGQEGKGDFPTHLREKGKG